MYYTFFITMDIRQIHASGTTWVNIGTPGKNELHFVEKLIHAHPQDIKDALPPAQRPKLVCREEYVFVIFQFPIYNRGTRRIEPSEIDFFVSRHQLVMIHDSRLEPLNELFHRASHNTREAGELMRQPSKLLISILETVFASINPMLNHISLDIDSVERQLLDGHNRQVIREILVVKRNIVNFRKIMQAHKSVLGDLEAESLNPLLNGLSKADCSELIHATIEIWDSLKNYEDSINALHDSHASLISVRQSEIIKTLTIISVLTFPLTLIATVFAIDARGGMPFVNHPQGFWIIVALLCAVALSMLMVFKKKKWI